MQTKLLQQRGALVDVLTGRPRIITVPPNLGTHNIAPAVIALVPEAVARENVIVPFDFDGETVAIASADPNNIALADRLRFLLAKNVCLALAPREQIVQAINRHYGRSEDKAAAGMLCEMETVPNRQVSAAAGPIAWQRRRLVEFRKGVKATDDEALAADEFSGDITEPQGMFFYVVREGERALMHRPNGAMEIIVGPRRVWRGRNRFEPMRQFIAHPGEFLSVRFRNGRQQHVPGPAEVWFDPREHAGIVKETALQLAAKEAVVVYSQADEGSAISQRIVHGPAMFVPRPGEWLHTFSWHASHGGHTGVQKVPNALVFQKLWLMPDQMYHDVTDVRTADDAVLTVRLMIFFELVNIERMLEATHDPIGDFVNAATSDVVSFIGQFDFEKFKHNTKLLNELETYAQLANRAAQCGYRINKVVYRGYGAAESLQLMHNQAIEARTRLQLDRATEQQAQELENYRLESQLSRASKRRTEQVAEVEHDLELARKREESAVRQRETRDAAHRESQRLAAEVRLTIDRNKDVQRREHLDALRNMGVDLTAYLTQARADQVIEVRGRGGRPHIHLRDGNSEPQAKSD